jgi:dimethylamine/trimethylamine dehydrogenase
MAREPRFDVLFEPVQIGPVIAPNRFYQVPHCTGMGSALPNSLAAMRGMKAEGGWGVVCSEYCSVHSSADDYPWPHCTLWDAEDVKAHALMTEAVHAHGALAGVELWYGGTGTASLGSRQPPLNVDSVPIGHFQPIQTRAMDKADIRDFIRWHRDAALRGRQAGYDIVYIYAGHGSHGYLPAYFHSAATNHRTDEYGGPLENRMRLTRELIEEVKDAVGDSCAVAVRFAADLGEGGPAPIERGEQMDIFASLAELPDLWDLVVNDFSYECGTSQFVKEGWNEPYFEGFKAMTTKPIVGVGRFTSPDAMLRQVTQGRLDLIGAARPSIADPFLPNKIAEGRPEDIRECIGCNMCIAYVRAGVALRCTQNPSMGEEWRRGWHPEHISGKGSDARVLVVGAGPAGLEAARALGQRGYDVTLAEASGQPGGRVSVESALPGMAEWARVRDWRVYQISQMPNVEMFFDSRLDAGQVREYGFDHVVIATGSRWRADGVGRRILGPLPGHDRANVFTPDDIMAGAEVPGPVVLFDDDHAYMGSLLAQVLVTNGASVTLVTPLGEAASWTRHTVSRDRVNRRLSDLGVTIVTNTLIAGLDSGSVELVGVYDGKRNRLEATSVVMVTGRIPNDGLYYELMSDETALREAGIGSVTRVGDCLAPGTIAAAVHSGHGYAQELDGPEPGDLAFRREHIALEPLS